MKGFPVTKPEIDSRYFVDAAAKALDVLESFDSSEDELSIAEIARRVRIPRSSAFRLLYTLEHRGYVMRQPTSKKFRRTPARKRFRLGYAALDDHRRITDGITRSLVLAAQASSVELIVRDNQFSASRAMANLDTLIQSGIHLLIEHQGTEAAAQAVVSRCHAAKIPLIAIGYAHPGACFFGGNNYSAGMMAGEYLAEFANSNWKGTPTTLVIAPHSIGMPSTHDARAQGICDGYRKKTTSKSAIVSLAPGYSAQDAYRAMKALLSERVVKGMKVLVASVSDQLAIGSARAVRDMNRSNDVIVISQGGSRETRSWIRRGSALRAAVAHFPERFGECVMSLALSILEGRKVPPVSYIDHVVLTRENVDCYYPPGTDA